MRILVVDDAAYLRALFTHIAEGLGHTVVGTAQTASEALAAASDLEPDAIVLDGRLRATDVGALIPALRAAVPACAVYLVAALDEAAVLALARERGAAAVIRRPFSVSQLRAVLGTHESDGSDAAV